MTNRPFGWEQFFATMLLLVTVITLAWFPNFSNADISSPALVIVLLALIVRITAKRDVSR